MKKSTAAISLVVVGSVLVGGSVGYLMTNKEEEQIIIDGENSTQASHSGTGSRGGFLFIPRFWGGYGGGSGGSVSSAPSTRGGFGSTGIGGSSTS